MRDRRETISLETCRVCGLGIVRAFGGVAKWRIRKRREFRDTDTEGGEVANA